MTLFRGQWKHNIDPDLNKVLLKWKQCCTKQAMLRVGVSQGYEQKKFCRGENIFESRNRFQYLSKSTAIDPYAGVTVTGPCAGVATTNTRQDLDTRRKEKRNQQRERFSNPKKNVFIVGDSMSKQIKRQDINYHLHDTIAHVAR